VNYSTKEWIAITYFASLSAALLGGLVEVSKDLRKDLSDRRKDSSQYYPRVRIGDAVYFLVSPFIPVYGTIAAGVHLYFMLIDLRRGLKTFLQRPLVPRLRTESDKEGS
jgi:hypothetical protein